MKVSIITPTYNAEKFIGRCLNHSLGQTYENIEVIVVDDGSIDSTVDIIMDYTKRDHRLKLLKQNHAGPNIARKKALDYVTGDYTLFVDADDFLVKDAVSILVNELQAFSVNSIRFNARYHHNDELVLPILSESEKWRIVGYDEVMGMLFNTYCLNSLCTQIYKTDYIKKVDAFNYDIVYGEDFLVNLEYHQKTKQMLLIKDALYCYCDNPKSTTRNHSKEQYLKNLSDRVFVSCKAMGDVSKYTNNIEVINSAYYAQLRTIKGDLSNLAKISGYTKGTFMNDIRKSLPQRTFKFVELKPLNDYMDRLGFMEKLKNQGIINAIAKSDYGLLWKYIQLIKAWNFIRSHGGKK